MKNRPYRFLQLILIIYLIAAFSWWTILLIQKNEQIYALRLMMVPETDQTSRIEEIKKTYTKTQFMIIGEGLVFAISIGVSIFLINRAFWTEIKSNRKLNNFLLSVTHELKTPIASLLLINRTLSQKKLSNEKNDELISTAIEETGRLESLVNNILTVTQMDNNYKYNFEKVNASELFQSRIHRFAKIYPDFKFSFINTSDKAYHFNVDKESIVKLIDNLLDNAVKYSGDSKEVEILVQDKENHVVLEVKDYGIGIKNEDRVKVLDKFYRVGNEEVRTSKGTGLGLFIVKEICKAHQAKLEIDTHWPRGTIFRILFRKKP